MSDEQRLLELDSMDLPDRHKLVAKWMGKERTEDMDMIFWLDDQWQKIYQDNRVIYGFSAAGIAAYYHVLSIVYGGIKEPLA